MPLETSMGVADIQYYNSENDQANIDCFTSKRDCNCLGKMRRSLIHIFVTHGFGSL